MIRFWIISIILGFDWISNPQIKMMNENSNIFINKKILVYGLGKSGVSSFKFLKGKNEVYLFDDNKRFNLRKNFKKKLFLFKRILINLNLM